MKVCHPKTIKEAIDDLQDFFEEDLWTQFFPEIIIPTTKNGKTKYITLKRKNYFKRNERLKFDKYINDHFDILRKEIKRLKK